MTQGIKTIEKNFTIDCTGKRLGRVASEIAHILIGKNSPSYSPEKDIKNVVFVENLLNLEFSGAKIERKSYIHHTGYPGGLRKESLGDLFARNPKKVLRLAVSGMLPKNKLRATRMKRLRFPS